jgi:DNA polymerase-3 subunit epsilon
MMPHMNGAELIHRLLDKKVTYPMVLMSANNWAEQFVRELANPNVSFIRKPFSVPQLTEIVATRLGLVLARHTAPAHVDLDALVQEGKRIRRRQGMTPEDSRAFDLFHRAAVAGHGEAQLLVYLRQLSVTTEFDTTVFSASGVGREGGQTEAPHTAALTALVIYADPELEQLRQLVAGARARLAELEADYTREKSRVDAMQAVLFRRLREHYQKRDRLRLIVDYRRKYLDALIRGGEDEAKETEENYAKAKAQTDKDYEETAAAVAKKKQLTPDEDAELTRLWKKLVKLYHPDRFAHEPDKLETYHKLTAAINRAKDTGDIATLREIAEDPHGYILRQGWVSLDFSDEAELSQLRQLYETLELETITVIESLNRLRESPDYELCQISEKKPGVLDELAAERKKLLEKESVELEKQAGQLAEEIKELAGQTSDRIV